MKFVPRYSLVLEVSDSGAFRRSLHDPDGLVVTYVSEAHEHDGYLYLGSFRSPFICRLSLQSVQPAQQLLSLCMPGIITLSHIQVQKEPWTQLCPCVPASPWKCGSSCCNLEKVWTLPMLSPKRYISPGLDVIFRGKQCICCEEDKPWKAISLFKNMLSTRILQYLENLIPLSQGSGFDDQNRGLAVQGTLACYWLYLTPSVSSF